MPDFFFGTPMDLAYYPPDTDEKMAAIMAFIGGTANVQKALENVHKLLPKLNTAYPSVEKYAVMGHCWGGKVWVLNFSINSTRLIVSRLQRSCLGLLPPSKRQSRPTRS